MTNDEIAHMVSDGLFPCACHSPKLVETHISWVILCDEYVFKIKKPVHYSFLDFSTIAKRKYYCEREVALNNRLTTDIYLEVLPIRRTATSFGIGSSAGKVVDHAVRMRRLKGELQMDILLRADKVTDQPIRSLAQQVAGFHRKATIVYPDNVLDIGDKFNDLANEKDFLNEQIGSSAGTAIVNALEQSEKFMIRNQELLTRRVREGFTRDGHGDLHSRNIFLYDLPVIFDCIEFNDDYRQIDLLNEVAFLCMDLDAFGYEKQANLFLDSYQEHFSILRNDQEEKLFHYYKSYRANVRAKVNSLRARSATDEKTRTAALKESTRYLDLMDSYIGRIG